MIQNEARGSKCRAIEVSAGCGFLEPETANTGTWTLFDIVGGMTPEWPPRILCHRRAKNKQTTKNNKPPTQANELEQGIRLKTN